MENINIREIQNIFVECDRIREQLDNEIIELSFTLSKDGVYKSISIFGAEDLTKLHKIINQNITKKVHNGGSTMVAYSEICGIRTTIFPKINTFNGCRTVEREVEVPEQPAIPAHIEKKLIVECGKQ